MVFTLCINFIPFQSCVFNNGFIVGRNQGWRNCDPKKCRLKGKKMKEKAAKVEMSVEIETF